MSKNFITIETSKSTYKIDFTTDTTDIWAIYSKFNGNITSVTLDNVSSYTIDGVAVTLPFEVEFNQVYLIKVVKTNPLLAASITFNTSYIQFDEVQTLPDFSLGSGHYTYGLSTTANCLYKIDNTLLTRANTSGVGTWTTTPAMSTITLPSLPAGGQWDRLVGLKDGKFLIVGSNPGIYDKYFTYFDGTSFTDMSGSSGYTTFLSNYSNQLYTIMYNYIDNYIYILEYANGERFVKIDLNTGNLSLKVLSFFLAYYNYGYNSKVFFNPYKKVFIERYEFDAENIHVERNLMSCVMGYQAGYNRVTNHYIIRRFGYNRIFEVDQYSIMINSYDCSGASSESAIYHYNIDSDNNVILTTGNNNKFAIFRLNDNKYISYILQNPEIGFNYVNNGMHAYGDLSLLIARNGKRLQCIDTSNPAVGTPADFNYYDFPTTIDDIYVNRLL